MTKSLKLRTLAVAVAGACGLSAGAANADVLSTSTISLTNLLFQQEGNTLDFSQFTVATFTSSADTSAAFTGNATLTGTSNTAPINLPLICNPSCAGTGLTSNGFEALTAPTSGSFAAADQNESGAPISGVTGFTTPATVESGSWAQVTSPVNADASATSNNKLNASFVFALNEGGTVDINYDFAYYWEFLVTGDEVAPTSANSSAQVEWTLKNVATNAVVNIFTPTALNWVQGFTALPIPLGFDVTDCSPGEDGAGCNSPGVKTVGSFTHTTAPLQAGVLYSLVAVLQTTADVNRVSVPEPGSLLLFGAALAGLGFARRRWSA